MPHARPAATLRILSGAGTKPSGPPPCVACVLRGAGMSRASLSWSPAGVMPGAPPEFVPPEQSPPGPARPTDPPRPGRIARPEVCWACAETLTLGSDCLLCICNTGFREVRETLSVWSICGDRGMKWESRGHKRDVVDYKVLPVHAEGSVSTHSCWLTDVNSHLERPCAP